jgi:hypothetical protein
MIFNAACDHAMTSALAYGPRQPHLSSKSHRRVARLSHRAATFGVITALHKVSTMIWKFLSLQKMLDALFDDSWFDFGLPEGYADSFTPVAQTLTP